MRTVYIGYGQLPKVRNMKQNFIATIAALFVLMIGMASAGEIDITAPVEDQKYYVWDEVPITYSLMPGDGWTYQTFVNGEETDVFAPMSDGLYTITVMASKVVDAENGISITSPFPRPTATRIVITNPVYNQVYHVGDEIPIEFTSPLNDREGVTFTAFMKEPGTTKKVELTDFIWTPTKVGQYGIMVQAQVDGFTFLSSRGYDVIA